MCLSSGGKPNIGRSRRIVARSYPAIPTLFDHETELQSRTRQRAQWVPSTLPIQATMYSEERSRKRTKTTKFVGPTSIEYEFKTATTSRSTKIVERLTYDPLSLFYAVRTMPLTTGQTLTFPITESGNSYR